MNIINENLKLKSIYNILKDIVMQEWVFKDLPSVGVPMEIPSSKFPESLNVNLEELQEALQKLNDIRVIEFDGVIKEKTYQPYSSEGYSIKIPIFRIWFLKDVDIEEEYPSEKKTLINRGRETGDFYYKNRPIRFENKNANYYLIFECLYEKGDVNGFCSYETINKYLESHSKEKSPDEQSIKDRIKNGIVNLFRFSDLPEKTPDGKKIIQKVRGKGIVLYNPLL